MVSEKKTALSTYLPQEYFEGPQKTTPIQANYDWYHRHRTGISWKITDIAKIITCRGCSSHISHTSVYIRNATYHRTGIK